MLVIAARDEAVHGNHAIVVEGPHRSRGGHPVVNFQSSLIRRRCKFTQNRPVICNRIVRPSIVRSMTRANSEALPNRTFDVFQNRKREPRPLQWAGQPDFNCALVCLGSAVITDRSKEFTDSGDRNTEATSGSSTTATVPCFIRVAKRFGRDLR